MVMELVDVMGNAYVTMDFKGQIVQVILQIIIFGSSILFKNFNENFDQKMDFFTAIQGCTNGKKSGGAGSNAARRPHWEFLS